MFRRLRPGSASQDDHNDTPRRATQIYSVVMSFMFETDGPLQPNQHSALEEASQAKLLGVSRMITDYGYRPQKPTVSVETLDTPDDKDHAIVVNAAVRMANDDQAMGLMSHLQRVGGKGAYVYVRPIFPSC